MGSPAAAIGWEFWQRHRWGLVAIGVYLFVLTAIKLSFGTAPFFGEDSGDTFGILIMVPLSGALFYLLAVFTYGLTGDVGAKESMYPPRLFTLPVTTAALAGWPMLYGTCTVASITLATTLLAPWPSGVDVPVVWSAVFAAVFLAWTQAFMWMPYGLRGFRVVMATLLLISIDAVVIVAIDLKISERVMVAALAPQLPLAYALAWLAVARARRGHVPNWRFDWTTRGGVREGAARTVRPFAAAARAQLWFEWQRHGRSLPILVAILMPFVLGLLFVPGNNTPTLVFAFVIGALVTPIVMAAFVAATVRKSNPDGADSYGITPFLATRPVTSVTMVAAKLWMTILSTMAAWLVVAVAIPVALVWSATWPILAERVGAFSDIVGVRSTIALLVLLLLALINATWKQFLQSLYVGLTGREGLVKAHVFLTLTALIFVGPFIRWLYVSRTAFAWFFNAAPWILGALVAVKMAAAVWVITRLYGSRLMSDRALVGLVAAWVGTVLVVYAAIIWAIDTPQLPDYFFLLLTIRAVPLVRLAAAPLALAWNRHR